MTLLSVSDLHCGYGANEVIHGIDFDADAGEVVTILGPNGCGKSTFLRSLLGYLRVPRGRVRFGGQDITPLSTVSRIALGLGYVPQITNVFRPLTVRENLEMGGYRLRRAATVAMVKKMFELFPVLGARAAQKAGNLSGGERQLLAMARAMMISPKLLLLDEPSAGLSPIRADDVFGHVRTIADLGVSVVVVEQDARRALAIATRGYVFVTGKVAFHGSPAEIVSDNRIHVAYLGGRARATPTPSHS
jgi:branched-chain amino acid transport system ATP-binding protein